jgi:tetratricopeptide (TPR) repeat protein
MTQFGKSMFHGAMVGREAEFARLESFLAHLDQGCSPGVLCIWSDAGVGKSRLVYELSLLRDDLNWLYVSSDEVARERSDPFGSFLCAYFEQDPCKDQQTNLRSFSRIWNGLLLNISVREHERCSSGVLEMLRHQEPALRAMLGLDVDGTLYMTLDPRSRSEHAHLAIAYLFTGLAALGPTVLVLDSIQWFSTEALGFLEDILDRKFPASLAVITMGRPSPDSQPGTSECKWSSKTSHMHLEGISRESIPQFFESLSGFRPSTDLTRLIWQIAGGIPLFIEQLSGFIRDSGCKSEGDSLELLETASGESTLNLSGCFSRRLDSQTPELVEVARSASVLGREFSPEILEHMHREQDLQRILEDGIELGIWAPVADARRFLFTHVLFRDHIYASTPEPLLSVLHSRAGAAIEEIYGRRRDNMRKLASHWEMAGEEEKAISCLLEAAGLAIGEFRNSDAVDIYRRLRNLVDDESRCAVDLSLARALDSAGLWSEGIDRLRNCLVSLAGCSDPRNALLQGEVRLLLGDILCRRGNYEEAEKEIRLAARLFDELGESGRETAAQAIHGRVLRHLGRYTSAASILEECVYRARGEGDSDLLCSVLGILGSLRLQMGDPVSCRSCFEEQIMLAEMHGLRRREAGALLNMLNLHRSAGEIDEASRCYHRLVAVSEETGDVNAVGIASNSMGSILVSKRDYSGALECFSTYLEVSERKNSMHGVATATCNMGVAYMLIGDQSRAIDCFMNVIDISTEMMNRQNTAIAYANMGRLLREMGRYECAIDCAETLLELATGIGFRSGVASAHMIMASGLHGLGENDRALAEIDTSVEITEEIREWRKIPTRLLRRARILYDMERMTDAHTCFDKALSASVRFDQPDAAFTARLYMAVIDAGKRGTTALECIEELIEKASTPEQEAAACYHFFRITNDRDHGMRALRIYRGILDDRILDIALDRSKELTRELDSSLP